MKFLKNNYKRIILIVIDFICVALAGIIANVMTVKFQDTNKLIIALLCEGVLTILFFYIVKLYSSLWRYAGSIELLRILISVFSVSLFDLLSLTVYNYYLSDTARSFFDLFSFAFVDGLLMLCSIGASRFFYRLIRGAKSKTLKHNDNLVKVMIIGGGDAGYLIIKELADSEKIYKKPVCIIDDDPFKLHKLIYGVPVVGSRDKIKEMAEKYDVGEIIVAIPAATKKERSEILNICKETQAKVSVLPGVFELVNGTVNVSKIRDVEISDLLGRDEIKVNIDEIIEYIKDKVVLVTGGGGSIGSELCRQIASHTPKQLIILDIYENNAYNIEQELKRKYPELNLLALIASIRDKGKIEDIFKKYNIDIVFNAAAHKHVPLMETSPNEAIKNNVFGTLNLSRCADKYGVKRFVQISTDKAVNPTNIMGASKRICEMIIQTIGKHSKTCEFVAVRFGNVLGSNGSVIPLFKREIKEGGPITVTDPNITRYFMTIPEAVSLVLQAGAYAKGGEIFVLDMGEPVKIFDLAINLIKLSGLTPYKDIDIKITGLRPGEKLYEERLMDEEGLERTPNGLISIAKPINLDEDNLFNTLDNLYIEAYKETEKMKELVMELVPTYKMDKRN